MGAGEMAETGTVFCCWIFARAGGQIDSLRFDAKPEARGGLHCVDTADGSVKIH